MLKVSPLPPFPLGCAFKGNKDEIVSHKAKCVYHDESQLLALTMKEVHTYYTPLFCTFTTFLSTGS